MILPVSTNSVEDRLVLVAQDPSDHRDWDGLLPHALPLFTHLDQRGNTLVRWSLPREEAEKWGFWGAGCTCCGLTNDSEGDVWEFDTNFDQTQYYTDALGVKQ